MGSFLEVLNELPSGELRQYVLEYGALQAFEGLDYELLFELLDDVEYRAAKMRYDPSTLSYTQDLKLGQQAAAGGRWNIQESLLLLPRLWKYALLRQNQTLRVDSYPLEAFKLLLLLDKEKGSEIINLVALMSDPIHQVFISLDLAEFLVTQLNRKQEGMQLLERACMVARTFDDVPNNLFEMLIQYQLWDLFDSVVYQRQRKISSAYLYFLVESLIETHYVQRAASVASLIEVAEYRADAFCLVARVFFQENLLEGFESASIEAYKATQTIAKSEKRAKALQRVGSMFTSVEQWARAEQIWNEVEQLIDLIEDLQERCTALQELGTILLASSQYQWAQAMWSKANVTAHKMQQIDHRVDALRELGSTLFQMQQCEDALKIWAEAATLAYTIEKTYERALALQELGQVCAQAQQGELALRLWNEAMAILPMIQGNDNKARVSRKLMHGFIQIQQWEQAEVVVRLSIQALFSYLSDFVDALIQAQRWKQARNAISTLNFSKELQSILRCKLRIAMAVALAQQGRRAQSISRRIEADAQRAESPYSRSQAWEYLVSELTKIQQFDQAFALVKAIEDEWTRFTLTNLVRTSYEEALIQALNWQNIQELIHTYYEDHVLAEIVSGLIQASQWEIALLAVRTIFAGTSDIEALCIVGIALAHADLQEWAQMIWNKAEIELNKIPGKNVNELTYAIYELYITLTEEEYWDHAQILWTQARKMSFSKRTMNSPSGSIVHKLCELGKELYQKEQYQHAEEIWKEAERIIRYSLVDDNGERSEAFKKLAIVLVQAHQWEWAFSLINTLSFTIHQYTVLDEIMKTLVKAQQWKQALGWACSLEQVDEKAHSLCTLALTLLKMQQQKYARIVLEESEAVMCSNEYQCSEIENSLKEKELKELATAWQQVGQWKRALFVIQYMKNSRIYALCDLGSVLTQVHQERLARKVWAEAEEAASIMDNDRAKVRALQKLGTSLARINQWQSAYRIWSKAAETALILGITVENEKIASLRELGSAICQEQQWNLAHQVWKKAEQEILTIKHVSERNSELHQLVLILAHHRQWDYAYAICDALTGDTYAKSDLLYIHGLAYTQIQHWEKAEEIIRSIEQPEKKIVALQALGEAFAQVQSWEKAQALWVETEKLVYSLASQIQRSSTLHTLGSIFASNGRWEWALKIGMTANTTIEKDECYYLKLGSDLLHTILRSKNTYLGTKTESMRKHLLLVIKQDKTFSKEAGLMLRLIQLLWLAIDTRDDVIRFLPLINSLIHFKPEIGISFYEAYTWTENFT